MSYYKAYQAYQQGHFDQCLALLQDYKAGEKEKLELKAQVYFRKKDYQKAYDIYRDLIVKDDEHSEEHEENLLTVIVCAQLEQPGVLKVKGKDKLPSTDDIVEQVELINLIDKNVSDLSVRIKSTKSRKKRKKRKIRFEVQHGAPFPDPERWLPRRDRKGVAHHQKKRRAKPNKKSVKSRPK